MCIYMYIYIYILYTYTPHRALLGIHYMGVQWEGGAVDGGSII